MERQRLQSPRIWVILARDAPVAVVFSRGPSKQVRLLKWNLRTDQFESGQWFKGRIYERRCDLSPDGKLLVYFASKQSQRENPTWTAISKPPYLTALALWWGVGCWNGGGHFIANDSVVLDRGIGEAELAAGFHLEKLRVTFAPFHMGEDAPMWETTLTRDGWRLASSGHRHKRGGANGWKYDPPICWIKSHPEKPLVLEMAIHSIGGTRERGWYRTRYRVLSNDGGGLPEMEADWADWDRKGDLLYAQDGKIHRQRHRHGKFQPPAELIDLNGQKFEKIESPPAAKRW